MEKAREHYLGYLAFFWRDNTFGRKPSADEPFDWTLHTCPFRNPADADALLSGLRKAKQFAKDDGLQAYDPPTGQPAPPGRLVPMRRARW